MICSSFSESIFFSAIVNDINGSLFQSPMFNVFWTYFKCQQFLNPWILRMLPVCWICTRKDASSGRKVSQNDVSRLERKRTSTNWASRKQEENFQELGFQFCTFFCNGLARVCRWRGWWRAPLDTDTPQASVFPPSQLPMRHYQTVRFIVPGSSRARSSDECCWWSSLEYAERTRALMCSKILLLAGRSKGQQIIQLLVYIILTSYHYRFTSSGSTISNSFFDFSTRSQVITCNHTMHRRGKRK